MSFSEAERMLPPFENFSLHLIDATHLLCLLPSKDNYCHAMDCAKTQEHKNEFHTISALKEYRFEEEKENRHCFFHCWFWGVSSSC